MTTSDLEAEQLQKMKIHPGFIAALDQSGGSRLLPRATRIAVRYDVAVLRRDSVLQWQLDRDSKLATECRLASD